MSTEVLRLAAYVAYLGAWVVFASFAILHAIPRSVGPDTSAPVRVSIPAMIGTLLQVVSALPITLSLPDGPLRPERLELAAALMLAPLGALLFVWSLRAAPKSATRNSLVTQGPYRWLRHPIYLAFFAMLVATGLLASAGLRLAAGIFLYLSGSELRIAVEEAELAHRYPEEHERYRRRTRWLYLPGLR
jgi:protein-S-isoprenylcysteine O-methyltransferase Ste14